MIPISLGRVLVVDDEPDLLAVLTEKLKRQGFHVVGCPTPHEALRVLREQSFEILLTDLMMPEMDGVALLRAALAIDPQIAGIVMTGQATVQTAVEALKTGAMDYVLKPFKTPTLIPVINRALEVRRLRTENLQLREAVAIDNLCKTIAFTTDLNAILAKVADGALEQSQADEASIMLPSADGKELYISAVKGPARGVLLGERVPIDQGIAGWVARTREPLLLDGPVNDPRFLPYRHREDIRSSVCMPMLVGGRLIGVLNVNSTRRPQSFTLGQLKALGILASTGAAAIEGALLFTRLAESEGRYRSIFENSVEGIIQSSRAGELHIVNPALVRMLGYASTEELKARVDRDEQLYENPGDWAQLWQRLERNGTVQGFETRFRRRDGSVIWVSLNGRLVHDLKGRAFLDCTAEDVSARKQAEESLHLFRTLLDRSSDVVVVIDPETGRFLDVNETGCRLLGYRRDEILELNWTDIELTFHERRYSWADAVKQVQTAGFRIVEGRHRRKDGTTFPVEINVTHAALNRGYLVAVVRDITERKQAERRLATQHAVTRALAESSSVDEGSERMLQSLCQSMGWKCAGLWLVDTRNESLRCHRTWHSPAESDAEFAKRLGQSAFAPGDELPGRAWATRQPVWMTELVPDTDLARFAASRGLTAAVGFPIILETQILGVVGVYHSESIHPHPELQGMIAGIGSQVGQFIERKRLEDQFRQAQKMEAVGQLAGGVAHDFNNLLTLINGYSELAFTQLPPDDPARELLAEVKKAGERATGLTRQLLMFSRKQVLQPRVLDLNAVIEELTKLLRRLIGEDLELTFVAGRAIGRVKVDPGQFEQALMNLAVNARDAMPTGGRLTLETQNVELDPAYAHAHHEVAPGHYVLLAVSDTGHGMDEATRSHIFEPFFTTKGPGKGTGLGLAMVFGFVRQSGGHIEVYSEVARGTTFKIYLPRIEENLPRNAPAAGRFEMPRGSETVLLVEDEDGVRSLGCLILRSCGYTVLEASNGETALGVARRTAGPIHLLVTDVVMPGMGGRELANHLATSRPDLKTLFVSGYTDDAVIRHGVLDEGVWFLQKPFTANALATKAREILDHR